MVQMVPKAVKGTLAKAHSRTEHFRVRNRAANLDAIQTVIPVQRDERVIPSHALEHQGLLVPLRILTSQLVLMNQIARVRWPSLPNPSRRPQLQPLERVLPQRKLSPQTKAA